MYNIHDKKTKYTSVMIVLQGYNQFDHGPQLVSQVRCFILWKIIQLPQLTQCISLVTIFIISNIIVDIEGTKVKKIFP